MPFAISEITTTIGLGVVRWVPFANRLCAGLVARFRCVHITRNALGNICALVEKGAGGSGKKAKNKR
jgi:hypothetical protein